MYATISQSEFVSRFHEMGRGNQFSYNALLALFEYYEAYEEDTGEAIEFDVIAICCDWAECDNAVEAYEEYTGEAAGEMDDDACQTWFEERTQVIAGEDFFLYFSF